MKRIFAITIILLLLAAPVYAFQNWSTSSGEQTASALIYTVVTGVRTAITSLTVLTDGTNDAKVILYDNTAASGTVVWECTVVGSDNYGGRNWVFPVEVSTGIYAAVTGTGASYIIEYIRR